MSNRTVSRAQRTPSYGVVNPKAATHDNESAVRARELLQPQAVTMLRLMTSRACLMLQNQLNVKLIWTTVKNNDSLTSLPFLPLPSGKAPNYWISSRRHSNNETLRGKVRWIGMPLLPSVSLSLLTMCRISSYCSILTFRGVFCIN